MLASLCLFLAQQAIEEGGLPKPAIVVGEVTSDSALIQVMVQDATEATRLFCVVNVRTTPELTPAEPILIGEFTLPESPGGLIRFALDDLEADTEYFCNVDIVKKGTSSFSRISTATFRTLPGADIRKPVSFIATNCMNYHYFMHGGQGRPAYQGEDKALGYPGLEAIANLDPDFVVFAGDNVYYDRPRDNMAKDAAAMRQHWHQLFAMPRMQQLMRTTPTYWLKDDHDHRFNDSDRTGEKKPSHELGRKIFREQVPVVALDDDETPTWRTIRVSRDLQIWMTEGRDHRSPNKMEPGPEKTMWGVEQRDWLKRTLLESDATFKILISPTPLVGPDDGYKADNQTNPKGFRHEGDAFHAWLAEHELNDQGFLVICGDRHWQYHSIHPLGTHEFSVGALIDANARLGRKPGDPKSTDPEATIKQPYSSEKPSGGFLQVKVLPSVSPRLELNFLDEQGVLLHRVTRSYSD